MTISYNKTVLAPGTATDDFSWSNVNSQTANSDRGCPANDGACVDFTLSSDVNAEISASVTAFSLLVYDISVWFFLPKGNSQYITDASSAVRVRVYDSNSNWAEWNQGGDSTLGGGWQMFLASGDTPDNTSGSIDFTNITTVALRVDSNASNTSDAPKYSIGEYKRGNKITVTGTDNTFQNIYDTSASNGWGVVQKEDVFVGLQCGLQVGDGSTTTDLTDTNIYIYGDQFNTNCEHPFVVKSNAMLETGSKLTGVDSDLYAIQGCSFIQREGMTADFTVEDGGVFKGYAVTFKNWNTITFADDTNEDSLVEMIKVEFDNNKAVLFNRTRCEMSDIKFHDPQGDLEVAEVNAIPDMMKNITVFNCADGVKFNVDALVDDFWAGSNTYDIVVLDTVANLSLANSVFSENKIKEVTS